MGEENVAGDQFSENENGGGRRDLALLFRERKSGRIVWREDQFSNNENGGGECGGMTI
jgi:hypothetical protein